MTPMRRVLAAISIVAGTATVAVLYAAPPVGQPKAPTYVTTADPQHPKALFDDSLVSLNDRCPVRLNTLSLAYVPVWVNGQPVAFCCHGCPSVFAQDPDRYLRALQIAPPDLFQKGKKATVDSSLRYRIGFEIFYFSSRADMERFKKDPLRYCGLLTDPISMVRFQPTSTSPHTTYSQRLYYFAADTCRAAFLKNPSLHRDRRDGTN